MHCAMRCFMSRPIGDPVLRFWKYVDKSGGVGACWPWKGGTNGKYGLFGMGGRAAGSSYAHRVSWMFANGPVPHGFHVCHHCDNPPCVNPAHLFVGSARDNAIDKCRKGRHWRQQNPEVQHGEENPNALLTAELVATIRRLYAERVATQVQLARMFDVARTTIGHVVRGDTWK